MFIEFGQLSYHNEIVIDDYMYPEEDFCIFLNFPHENYVLTLFDTCFKSCTFRWLIQYKNFFRLPFYFECEQFKYCNFSQMIQLCRLLDKRQNYSLGQENADLYLLYDQNYKNKFYDFVLSIILIPSISIFAICTNLLNILVLSNRNFKELKKRLFRKMLISSYINVIICLVQIFGISIKCIDPLSYYCMFLFIANKKTRYAGLVIYIYLGNVLRTCSKLFQISIAFDRFVLSTDSKKRNLQKIVKIQVKSLLIFTLFTSSFLNLIKIFEYEFDLQETVYEQFKFPFIFKYYFNLNFFYSYLNLLNIIVNNICLFLIQFYLDVSLLWFVHKSIKNKEKLFKNKRNFQKDKKCVTEKKIKIMIVLNGFFMFVLHIPDLFISIGLAFSFKGFEFQQNLLDYFTHVLNNISDLCYILSLSLNFFVFFFFNNFFRKSFHNIFG
jgi:hypothetical protein